MNRHDNREHQLLSHIERGDHLSQRSRATSLGIALGLTNLLIKRVVKKGWVKAVHIKPNRVTYLLTPAGIAEKARLSSEYLQGSLLYYGEVRDRVREGLMAISQDWPTGADATEKRIAFFGADESAEITYICLQGTDFKLVAVVAEPPHKHFCGMPVHPVEELRDGMVGDIPFDRLVVTSFEGRSRTHEQLAALGMPPERVRWL